MTYSELKPEKLFRYFRLLSDIPRGSGNEAAAARFVYDTAIRLGYPAEIDDADNVLVRAPASPGYEDHAPMMLQGHLDMVCEANRSTVHDFLADPIEFVLCGDELRANGTTLGADDGVAVAVMLSILDSDLPHPALECLFTTSEETGMNGMRTFDPAKAVSRRLLNLDSEEEGAAVVSCAGGVRSHLFFDYDREEIPADYRIVQLTVTGLFGGHSGEDINLGRTNAIVTAARMLFAASRVCDLRIASLEGGSRDNAIPRECFVTLAVSDYDAFSSVIAAECGKIRGELIPDDAGFQVLVEDAEAPEALSSVRSVQLLTLLRTLPNGVHGMCRQIPGLVETSSNLAVVRKWEGGCEIVVSSRSSVESRLDEMQDRMECCAVLAGATCEHIGRYPGWDYHEGSPMQQLYLDTYRELFGKEAKVVGLHAGLECGLLKGRLPDMDIISIGPDVKNLHSPEEVLSVSSFVRLWELVCRILKNA